MLNCFYKKIGAVFEATMSFKKLIYSGNDDNTEELKLVNKYE